MTVYEYKVIPAPNRGEKAKGIKGPEARFAFALENSLNALATDGWEFWRSETLPSEERSGLTHTATHWRSVMIFRRVSTGDAEMHVPQIVGDDASTPVDGDKQAAQAEDQSSATVLPIMPSLHAHRDDRDDPT